MEDRVLSQRAITAKTSHRCVECWGTIQRGEQYEYTAQIYDGGFGTYKLCLPCVDVWRQVSKICGYDLTLEFGEGREYLRRYLVTRLSGEKWYGEP